MKVNIKSALIELGSSSFKASALENVSQTWFGSVSLKSYANNNYADCSMVIKYDRNRKSHDIQKEQFSRLYNITSKWWPLKCYLVVTCLLVKYSGRKGKWHSTHTLIYRYSDRKQSDREICGFVIISFHELICAMKTKGQWSWNGTAQSALIMKHWIMKDIIKTNILQHGTWFLGLIFREISSPKETYS